MYEGQHESDVIDEGIFRMQMGNLMRRAKRVTPSQSAPGGKKRAAFAHGS